MHCRNPIVIHSVQNMDRAKNFYMRAFNIEEMQIEIERQGGTMSELREAEKEVYVRLATFMDCEGNGFELR